ncbi:MAG: zinc-binding dehydrogenase, partial [Gemmatimonadaceae bacterium]
RVAEWTDARGVDVILELVGGAYVPADVRAAAPLARIILIGTIAGTSPTLPLHLVMAKRLTIRGTVLRARSVHEKIAATSAFAADVIPMLASGVVRPVIDRVYPLAEIRMAHERMESNASFGKIVLEH